MTADDIIVAARSMIGTPFRHQGRIPGHGLDCAGLVVSVADALGVAHCDRTDYAKTPANGQLRAQLDMQPGLKRIPVASASPGDILLMRFNKEDQHLVILAGKTIIHSHAQAGKVVEHEFDAAWQKRVMACYRFNGVSA